MAVTLLAFEAVGSRQKAGGQAEAPSRLDRGRFTAVFYPTETKLAAALLAEAARNDTFPGLPRPKQRVLIAIAPDAKRFREWIGPNAPEWGAAIAFPESERIVMQGRTAGSDAGNPLEVVRHELAHLALHESLGDLPPRWFDEGYASFAAREWSRDDALIANVGLALRGMPKLDDLDAWFTRGPSTAQSAYAMSYRAVAELAALDPERGLALFFDDWRTTRSMDRAVRAAYGVTLDGFEKLWRQRTRRRYGALALAGDVTLAGLVLLFILVPLYLARRQRDRERMAALVAADAVAERSARQSALDEMMRRDDGGEPGDGPTAPAQF